MTKRNQPPLHGGKSTAQRHATRREQKAKYDKPDRWTDSNGKFTVPHTKEQR